MKHTTSSTDRAILRLLNPSIDWHQDLGRTVTSQPQTVPLCFAKQLRFNGRTASTLRVVIWPTGYGAVGIKLLADNGTYIKFQYRNGWIRRSAIVMRALALWR